MKNQVARISDSTFSEPVRDFVAECRAQVIDVAQSRLKFRRDDYKEFMELCLVFLSADDGYSEGDAQGQSRISTAFKQPGALHKAWLMAKLLYSIKICLSENQIKLLPQVQQQ